ncbi:AI-2E family transporter [Desulfocurvus vexinensis]|uniref:AI-2E family transporter n=1 Tax=Desulfocurvus vexinensis TaxID=399548 RepID=UPI0004B92D65|nr:AI-2E family transporter [Desulfocurvus vexinensis]
MSTIPDDNAGGLKGPTSNIYKWVLAALILLALYLGYRVFSPFLAPVIFSSVLAAIFYPLQARLAARLGGRDTLAALAVLVLVVVCVFLPTFVFFSGLVSQAATSIADLTAWVRSEDFARLAQRARVDEVTAWLHERLPFLDLSGLDIQAGLLDFSRNLGQTVISTGTSIVGNAVDVLFSFLIMLFVLFFFLRDGRRIVAYVKYLSPLHESQEDSIIASLRNVSRAVLVGGLLVAVLQGVAGGVGLAIAGIPALFWGTMMGFTSLIPVLGTGLVWVPASTYLLLTGQWKMGVFLLIWCGVGVTSIDTFLRPYFMRGSSGMPLLAIFLSVIGGLQIFGPAGLLYGPLILAFAMVMLRLYGEEFREILEFDPRRPPGGPCPPGEG